MDKDRIEISHLTPYQVEMLDHMWSLDTEQEYLEWYNLLDEEDQLQADTLTRMVIIEMIEQEAAVTQNHYPEARAVLSKFMLNKE